jgi:hypothetical protein
MQGAVGVGKLVWLYPEAEADTVFAACVVSTGDSYSKCDIDIGHDISPANIYPIV